MSSNKCAKCEQTVYPVEGLRCLDKIWHKGCFKCHECNMTLNLKNYKGFEKRPYCNAHCPQAKATTVADTPEIRRLAENTRIQSQAKYHEDFEKSKGKGFTTIADDPELRRVKETSKIISNVAYHGEIEKKKQMEKLRGSGGQDDLYPMRSGITNNNLDHQQNRMQHNNHSQSIDTDYSPSKQGKIILNSTQQRQIQQQLQQQQIFQLRQQQQIAHKQQQQQILLKQQQQEYIQSHNVQANMMGRGNNVVPRQVQQQYPVNLNQQQQQLLLRQQQQQQQHNMMQQHMMQQRQSIDPNMPLGLQPTKQAINSSNHSQQQHLIKHQQIIQAQQPIIKYVPIGDAMGHNQAIQHNLVNAVPSSDHMLDPPATGGAEPMPNSQRTGPALVGVSPQTPTLNYHHHQNPQHQMVHSGVYNQINGPIMHSTTSNQSHQLHLTKVHQHHSTNNTHNQVNAQQIRSIPAQLQQGMSQMQLGQQVPRRVFRAMYDYVANDVDEVSFYENDILIDCVNVDRNWLIGRVARTGQTGMLPANYVSELPSQ